MHAFDVLKRYPARSSSLWGVAAVRGPHHVRPGWGHGVTDLSSHLQNGCHRSSGEGTGVKHASVMITEDIGTTCIHSWLTFGVVDFSLGPPRGRSGPSRPLSLAGTLRGFGDTSRRLRGDLRAGDETIGRLAVGRCLALSLGAGSAVLILPHTQFPFRHSAF